MGTYPNRHPMIPEANNGDAYIPNFPWIHPGNFFPPTRISFDPFQSPQMNSKPTGFAAVPICSVGPMTEPTNNSGFETNPSKKNKAKKTSSKSTPKVVRPKQPKKKPPSKKDKGQIKPRGNIERKNMNIRETDLDVSGVPPPLCSCTGVTRGCYKWGAGGWQSSCCNSSISEYPLPMNPSKPGTRLPGRKMSSGAYGKLLDRLAADGHDLSRPVDLKNHWARHGTNKFVTIK